MAGFRVAQRDGLSNNLFAKNLSNQEGAGLIRVKSSLISLLPASESTCRLFCIHHAGGSTAVFRNWPGLLGPSVQVGTIALPGREGLFGQPPLTDLEVAVQRVCTDIQRFTDKPYALFGHSLGAVLAFEATCRLERDCPNHPPVCLIVSGRRALNLKNPSAALYSASDFGERAPSTLPDAEFISLLRRFGGTAPEILNNPEMMELLLPVIRADFSLVENYKWDGQSRTRCSILVLGGTADGSASFEELTQWCTLSRRDVTVQTFDGGHFFISTCEAEACTVIAHFLDRNMRNRMLKHRTNRTGPYFQG
jgi:surfactin synthase thioesterase subunit